MIDMLCQSCQKRIASVHFTQVINGRKVEAFLCSQCSAEKGQMSFTAPFGFSDFLSGLIGFSDGAPQVLEPETRKICAMCGMSFEDFQKTGKLGCSRCFEAFGDRLHPILRRLHGDVEHRGKATARMAPAIKTGREIEKLKKDLENAVHSEEYEKAAELRDAIKVLERGGE